MIALTQAALPPSSRGAHGPCSSLGNQKVRLSTSKHGPHAHSPGRKLETQVSLELQAGRTEDPQAFPERVGNVLGC